MNGNIMAYIPWKGLEKKPLPQTNCDVTDNITSNEGKIIQTAFERLGEFKNQL